jgi:hypothetical protein
VGFSNIIRPWREKFYIDAIGNQPNWQSPTGNHLFYAFWEMRCRNYDGVAIAQNISKQPPRQTRAGAEFENFVSVA